MQVNTKYTDFIYIQLPLIRRQNSLRTFCTNLEKSFERFSSSTRSFIPVNFGLHSSTKSCKTNSAQQLKVITSIMVCFIDVHSKYIFCRMIVWIYVCENKS